MNFDTNTRRRGTGSLKWDKHPQLTPFWVADMDFTSPPAVIEAIKRRTDHGVFGYALPHEGLWEALTDYGKHRLNFDISPSNTSLLGGLVPALHLAVKAFCQAGDSIMVGTPVYAPFLNIHRDNQVKSIQIKYLYHQDRWSFDWGEMEKAIQPHTKLFLLSNPQNPLSRVFSETEIQQLANFCERHDLILVSDEIHCDLIFNEKTTPHYSALNLPAKFLDRCITLLSPSKTYNIAGLGFAYAVIPNRKHLAKFEQSKGYSQPEINLLAYYAAEAAYRFGGSWRKELMSYLQANRGLLLSFFQKEFPAVKIPNLEATYLAWLDFNELKLNNPVTLFQQKEKLFLSPGSWYGDAHCVRLNFACSRNLLEQCLNKIQTCLNSNE